MKSNKLPDEAKKLLLEIHDIIREDEFILYGGSPIDMLLNRNTKVHELDIAIKRTGKAKIKKFRDLIKRKGFKIVEPYREYYIYKNKKVIIVYAQNKKWFLDVAFLDNPKLIGHFNIETLYFRYPQLDYIDRFNALAGIKKKNIKLVRNIREENPHLLLGRFLRLCAKYNISLNNKNSKKILISLKNQIDRWKIKNAFHKSAYISCISSLLKSIVKAYNKKTFVETLINTSVLKTIFPETSNIIRLKKKDFIDDFTKIKTKLDVVVLFYKYLKSSDGMMSFRNKIKSLKVRRWDKEDIECSKYPKQ